MFLGAAALGSIQTEDFVGDTHRMPVVAQCRRQFISMKPFSPRCSSSRVAVSPALVTASRSSRCWKGPRATPLPRAHSLNARTCTCLIHKQHMASDPTGVPEPLGLQKAFQIEMRGAGHWLCEGEAVAVNGSIFIRASRFNSGCFRPRLSLGESPLWKEKLCIK